MSEVDEGVLKALVDKVTTLAENVAVLTAKMPEDHEARIRQLEVAVAQNAWVPVLVTAVVTAIIVALAVGYINKKRDIT